jgi:glycosyltransferase involved in cell wall biosynthesis
LNILYDHQIWENQTYGGASRLFWEIARQISANPEISVTLFAGLYINRYISRAHQNLNPGVLKGIYLDDYPGTRRLRQTINSYLFRKWIVSRGKVWDIFHPTNYDINFVPRGARLVVTVFDMINELFPQYYRDSLERTQVKKKAVLTANQIIAISSSTRNDLVRLFEVNPDNITVIPLAPSLDFSGVSNQQSEKRPYLLYVGERSPSYKNSRLLLEAFARVSSEFPELKLIFFGGGKFSNLELESLSEIQPPINKENIVQISGDDLMLASYYKYAEALVYPSIYEGFGLPLVEAMRAGCPVLASSASSIPEVLGDAGCLFNPSDLASLTAAIIQTIHNRDYRGEMIKKGFSRSQEFSWKRTADQTLAVYLKALS